MSCCAVGIWAITDLKREKNRVQTSKAPAFEQLGDLVGDLLGGARSAAPAPELDDVDDLFLVQRLADRTLAATHRIHLLALLSATWRLRASRTWPS